jgi:hypothetical protein
MKIIILATDSQICHPALACPPMEGCGIQVLLFSFVILNAVKDPEVKLSRKTIIIPYLVLIH